jgi:hypothetical protein
MESTLANNLVTPKKLIKNKYVNLLLWSNKVKKQKRNRRSKLNMRNGEIKEKKIKKKPTKPQKRCVEVVKKISKGELSLQKCHRKNTKKQNNMEKDRTPRNKRIKEM